jgi:hypothetical protein
MRIKKTVLMVAILAVVLPSIRAADDHKLVQTWVDPAYEGRRLHKVIVVCIAGLTLERKQFEDKFLTHLRGRNIDGITSHSIVPHLDEVEDREALIRALHAKGIEGAITVRLVRLDDQTEEEWAEAWGRQPGSGIRIRDLVEQTLPVPEEDAKHYGVEVALWEADQWNMVWAARSDTYRRHELKKAAAPFVQRTMIALIDEGILP